MHAAFGPRLGRIPTVMVMVSGTLGAGGHEFSSKQKDQEKGDIGQNAK